MTSSLSAPLAALGALVEAVRRKPYLHIGLVHEHCSICVALPAAQEALTLMAQDISICEEDKAELRAELVRAKERAGARIDWLEESLAAEWVRYGQIKTMEEARSIVRASSLESPRSGFGMSAP